MALTAEHGGLDSERDGEGGHSQERAQLLLGPRDSGCPPGPRRRRCESRRWRALPGQGGGLFGRRSHLAEAGRRGNGRRVLDVEVTAR